MFHKNSERPLNEIETVKLFEMNLGQNWIENGCKMVKFKLNSLKLTLE